MGGQLSLLYALAAQEIQDLTIFCVNKDGGAHLAAFLQNAEESSVIHMER